MNEPNIHNVIFEIDSSEYNERSTLLGSNITNGSPLNLFGPYNVYQWTGARVDIEDGIRILIVSLKVLDPATQVDENC